MDRGSETRISSDEAHCLICADHCHRMPALKQTTTDAEEGRTCRNPTAAAGRAESSSIRGQKWSAFCRAAAGIAAADPCPKRLCWSLSVLTVLTISAAYVLWVIWPYKGCNERIDLRVSIEFPADCLPSSR
jgi:hypothetical protein